jgi:lipopolysaccharide transport system permease protein/teichoic acid transport system permease protein
MKENIVSLGRFLKKLYVCRGMIKAMAMRDIQSRYMGTLGGFAWFIIQPLSIALVYWFVFSKGFKVQPAGGIPFIVVFLCGLIPWSMFAEALNASTASINANSHLVTKNIFPTEILPVVSLVSSLFTHVLMMLIFLVIMLVNKISFSLFNLQFFYYLFALSVFSLGLGWFLSAVNVFCKDVGQALGVVLNLWFWATPIVWLQTILPPHYQFFLKFNPMYYIVDGYRSSFIYHAPIWHNPRQGLYFWIVCAFVFIVGALTFRKLKPEFAEVL